MKKTFFSLALVFAGLTMFAQNHNRDDHHNNDNRHHDNDQSQTPQQIRDGFNREHPNASNAQWNQSNGNWHATYSDDKHRNVDDYYNNHGNRMYSRVAWDKKNLSHDYDRKIWGKYHTRNYQVTRIERPRQQSLFEIVLNIGGRNKTVYTDERGNEVQFKLGF